MWQFQQFQQGFPLNNNHIRLQLLICPIGSIIVLQQGRSHSGYLCLTPSSKASGFKPSFPAHTKQPHLIRRGQRVGPGLRSSPGDPNLILLTVRHTWAGEQGGSVSGLDWLVLHCNTVARIALRFIHIAYKWLVSQCFPQAIWSSLKSLFFQTR